MDETEFTIVCDPRIAQLVCDRLKANPIPHPSNDGRQPTNLTTRAAADPFDLIVGRSDKVEILIRYDKPQPTLESLAEKWLKTFEYADRARLWMAMHRRGTPSIRIKGSKLTLVDAGLINPPPCVIEIS